uniref:Basic tail secreted protein n=1 Tax=Rhipicephalus zambeziensis TaxID=60191 RepID=A0A224Y9W6_9ACAR
MRIRSVPLFVLGFTVLFQLLDGVGGDQCPKKIWRRLGLTGFLSGCRYWCRGLLPKIGYEKDGTPCTSFFPKRCLPKRQLHYGCPTRSEPATNQRRAWRTKQQGCRPVERRWRKHRGREEFHWTGTSQ